MTETDDDPMVLIKNSVQCLKCQEIIVSTYRHDFKYCKCGAVFIDGGLDYLRYGGNSGEFKTLFEYARKSSLPPKPKPRDWTTCQEIEYYNRVIEITKPSPKTPQEQIEELRQEVNRLKKKSAQQQKKD